MPSGARWPAGDVTDPAGGQDELVEPREVRLSSRRFTSIVAHLVKRELDATHRLTVLGWAWPVIRQVAQLAILVFIFGHVLNLNIPHFPVYVFSGLLSWTWFATGLATASTCLLDQRHLLFQPRFPAAVLPIVAISVPLVDLGVALPLLIAIAVAEEGVRWTAILLPLLIVLQFTLMAGLAWIVSTAAVFLRDVPNIVTVVLLGLFYMTPVFYRIHTIENRTYTHILDVNPLTTVVEGYRSLLLGGHAEPLPDLRRFAYVVVLSLALVAVGRWFFRRNAALLVDSL
jgi:lipopolysaccharide transport system permease protein